MYSMSWNDAGKTFSNILSERELTQEDYDIALNKLSNLQYKERTIQDKIEKNSKSYNFFSKNKINKDLETQLNNVQSEINQQYKIMREYDSLKTYYKNKDLFEKQRNLPLNIISPDEKLKRETVANDVYKKKVEEENKRKLSTYNKLKDELNQCNAKLSEQGSLELSGLSEGGGRKSRKSRKSRKGRKGKTKRKGRKGKSKRRKSRR